MKKIALLLICAMLLGAAGCAGSAAGYENVSEGQSSAGKTPAGETDAGGTGSSSGKQENTGNTGSTSVTPLKGSILSADAVSLGTTDENDWNAILDVRNKNKVGDDFAAAVDRFAFGSAKSLLAGDKNSCYSPLSLYFALAVCASGAAGDTQREMLDALGVKDEETLRAECAALFRRLWTDGETTKIKISNALFVDDGFQGVKESYADKVTKDFYASVKTVDFGSAAETKKIISDYIFEKTAGKLSYQGEPDPDTKVSIINTVYFIAQWSDQFSEWATNKETFRTPSGDKECDMMHDTYSRLTYYRGNGFLRVELSFTDGSRMAFVLPDEGKMNDVLAMGADAFRTGEATTSKVSLYLPKFKIRSSLDLEEMLNGLSIVKAFTDGADFSPMSELSLRISKVFQATYISVDEKGAEAAAYTEVVMMPTSAYDPTEPVTIRFDRPFLYAIEAFDGTVMFTGVVADPSAN